MELSKKGVVMVKVTGLDRLARMVEAKEKMQEIKRKALRRRINELMDQGIDREIAEVMAKQGL